MNAIATILDKVLYHGSSCNFSRFIFTGTGEPGFHFGNQEVAMTFTRDRETDEQFKNATLVAVKLAIHNAYVSPDVFPVFETVAFVNLLENGIISAEEFAGIEEDLFEGGARFRRNGQWFLELDEADIKGRNRAAEVYKRALQAKGFDGVMYSNCKAYEGEGETCYIAFEKSQIEVVEVSVL